MVGESSGYKDYVAGMLAGVATVITGHPFDTVKVNLQKHNTSADGIKYMNGLHCAARILKAEGVKGLYRGASSSFVGMAFESSFAFGIYSQTKRFLQGGIDGGQPQANVIIPSAAFAGGLISFVLCPSELVKCRMQIQSTGSLLPRSTRYSGPLECAIKTIKIEGVKGIFRGGFATLLRESVGNAVFFSTYEYVRHQMHLQLKGASSKSNQLVDVGVGIMSGGIGGILVCMSIIYNLALNVWKLTAPPDLSDLLPISSILFNLLVLICAIMTHVFLYFVLISAGVLFCHWTSQKL
ncbi:hypothetical protein DM860_001963 [Cuscuta australis]|uniref:Uncharacterized protein n=1 Tax=Cuscuta australis TaxID=267555 RepID=A0A328DVH1_9ASTE|nr:hypothetical protein DM860_001963 [Cuscuta australis]